MKRYLLLIFTISYAVTFCAQNAQKGIVKTKGRLNEDQTITKGTPLSDAYVTVQGAQTVSSNKKGLFSVALTSKDYYLKDVNKEGYVLCDADILSRPYAYSPNPLYIVMETPAQQMEDKIFAERKLRRTLQRQLIQREDEIDSLKTRQQISEEEYRQQLQQIYSDQKENERLIAEMAERYASIDYDQLDEFNRQISALILEGKLTEADSLIRTKGDIASRIESLKEHQEKNQQEELAIKKRMKALEKSKAYTQKELEDLAQDCYSLYEIFKMQHKNDSAAYYLELRASLDTTNMEWSINAADYIQKYLANYTYANSVYNKALKNAYANIDSVSIGVCYTKLGLLNIQISNYPIALNYLDSSLYYIGNALGRQYLQIAVIKNHKGVAYALSEQYEKAHACYEDALKIIDTYYSDNEIEKAKIYFNLGNLMNNKAQYEKAKEYYQMALIHFKQDSLVYEMEIDDVYNNLAILYGRFAEFEKSIKLNKEILSRRIKILGRNHPNVAASYHNIGIEYSAMQNYDSAWFYYQQAFEIREKVLGLTHVESIKSLSCIGSTYAFMGQDSIAEEILLSCIEMYENTIGNNNSHVASVYYNLIDIYIREHKYEKAKDYLKIEEQIYRSIYGTSHPKYAIALAGFADVYDEIGENKLSYECYDQAYKLLKSILPEDHPGVQLMKNSRDVQQEKLKE